MNLGLLIPDSKKTVKSKTNNSLYSFNLFFVIKVNNKNEVDGLGN